MRQPGPLYIAALAILGVALLLGVIGLGSNSWISATGSNSGLWKLCVGSTCFTYTSVLDYIEATRAFTILGFLIGVAALLIAIVRLFIESLDTKIIGLAAAGLIFAAAFGFFLGTMIFAGKFNEINPSGSKASLGYSFALDIVAWLLMIASGALLCFDVVRGSADGAAAASMAKA